MGFKKLGKKFSKLASKITKNPLFSAALSIVPGGGIASMAINAVSAASTARKRVTDLAPPQQAQVAQAVQQIEQASQGQAYQPAAPPPDVSQQVQTIQQLLAPTPRVPLSRPVYAEVEARPPRYPSYAELQPTVEMNENGEYDSPWMDEDDRLEDAIYTFADAMIAFGDYDNSPIVS